MDSKHQTLKQVALPVPDGFRSNVNNRTDSVPARFQCGFIGTGLQSILDNTSLFHCPVLSFSLGFGKRSNGGET